MHRPNLRESLFHRLIPSFLRAVPFWSLLVLLALNSTTEARTWKVHPDGSGDAPTIQAAVDSSVAGDSVLVAEGRYAERVVLQPNRFTIGSWNASFTSFDVSTTPTTIDADTLGTCLFAAFDGTVDSMGVVSSFRLVDGRGAMHEGFTRGGGLHARNLRQIQNCVAESCFADYGGGIFATGDRLHLTGVVARRNTAAFGGSGVRVDASEFAQIEGMTAEANSIPLEAVGPIQGVGLFISGPKCLIDSSQFLENDAFPFFANQLFGLGVFSDCLVTEVEDCEFIGNGEGSGLGSRPDNATELLLSPSASRLARRLPTECRGGGISCLNGSIRNSLFDSNGFIFDDNASGGGIWMTSGEVIGCTLLANSANGNEGIGRGGAIFADSVRVESCLIEKNHSGGSFRGEGGGIAGRWISARNCRVLENSSTCSSGPNCTQGGGIFAEVLQATNCTLGRNHLGFEVAGDGIGVFVPPTGSGLVQNCIFIENRMLPPWGASLPDVGGLMGPVLSNHNLFWNNEGSASQGLVDSTAHLHVDPLLADLDGGDVHLLLHSPAIDRGDPAIPDADGSISDRGAYGGPASPLDQPASILGFQGIGTGFGNEMQWTPSGASDLSGYAIYRSSIPGVPPGLPTFLGAIPPGNAKFTHRPAYPGLTFHYRVSAFDSTNYGGGYSDNLALTATPWMGEGGNSPAFEIAGNTSQAFFGAGTAAADLNDDGFDDLVVGAPGNGNGRVLVFWGVNSFAPPSEANADVVILAPRAGEDFGWVLGAGDVSGDGVDDLMIGASRASPLGRNLAGAVYIVEGRTDWPASPVTVDLAVQPADRTYLGAVAEDRTGASFALGDLNGDLATDLVLGAPEHITPGGRRDGEARILYSIATAPDSIDLAAGSIPFTVVHSDTSGLLSGDRLGCAVAVGDLTGDGIDDLAVGSRAEDPGDVSAAGSVHVIAGAASLSSTPLIDLRVTPAFLRLDGVGVSDELGASLAILDLEGDGSLDLVAGAPGAERPLTSLTVGAVYMVRVMSAPGPIQNLYKHPAWMSVYGEAIGGSLGAAVAYGKPGGPGDNHLWMGARTNVSNRGTAAAIWGGRPLYPGVVALEQSLEDWRFEGPINADAVVPPFLGGSVAMGDFDGDGRLDLATGAYGADPGGQFNAGIVAILMNEDAVGVEEVVSPTAGGANFGLVSRGPNPSKDTIRYGIEMASRGEVDVEVFDVTGRRVSQETVMLDRGLSEMEWPQSNDGHRASSGIYWIRARSGSSAADLRVVLLR